MDRNVLAGLENTLSYWSPSSRRAWIEIDFHVVSQHAVGVALLAEGVDRNNKYMQAPSYTLPSPSSRRAWIEIDRLLLLSAWSGVALLAEGVDRNSTRRSMHRATQRSPSSRRAWIEITL